MRFSLISAIAAAGVLCVAGTALANPVELTPVRSISDGVSPDAAEAFYAEISEKCRAEAAYRPFLDGEPMDRTDMIRLVGCVGQRSGQTIWAIFNGKTPMIIAEGDVPKLFRVIYHRETVVLPFD